MPQYGHSMPQYGTLHTIAHSAHTIAHSATCPHTVARVSSYCGSMCIYCGTYEDTHTVARMRTRSTVARMRTRSMRTRRHCVRLCAHTSSKAALFLVFEKKKVVKPRFSSFLKEEKKSAANAHTVAVPEEGSVRARTHTHTRTHAHTTA